MALDAPMAAPTELTVDLGALAANFRTLQAVSGAQVHPVVKADAYGLGAAACARRLRAEGAEIFFVARLEEGVALRLDLGPGPIIYVLDGCSEDAAPSLKASGLRPVLNDGDQLTAWRVAGGGPCAVQIDTGMNRLGFRPEDAPVSFPGLAMVLSHLACADDPSAVMNARQRRDFAALAGRYPGAIQSFANSGGCFLGQEYAFDAVRPGIALYGGGPHGRPDPRIRPVATFSARILQLRGLSVGESVGYSAGFVTDRPRRIATIAAGYADGVLRAYSPRGQAYIGGELRSLLGRVSMDVCAVDATDLDVRVGDPVELFGANRPLDDAAAAADTVAWELLTSVGSRVPRRYIGA